MTIKTYSRARSAVAALTKLLAMHETEGEITTNEVEPGRFAASVAFEDQIMPELADDLTAQGFAFTTPEEDEDEGDEEETPVIRRPKYIREHSDHRGVVAEVHAICDENTHLRRSEVIELCREAGIAFGTARTQYQKWFENEKKTTLQK